MDLLGQEAAQRPEVQALTQSLLDYMNSAKFVPKGKLGVEEATDLFRAPVPRRFPGFFGFNTPPAPQAPTAPLQEF